ncbi:MAG: hypothetical protein K1X74_00380 [Pirellulales bacterium]|nr:hypothetical protein [Pirellulales bacterium]
MTQEVARGDDYCRPFDRERRGTTFGEGAATFLLETRRQAEGRGAPILATILGFGSSAAVATGNGRAATDAIERAIRAALADARLAPAEIGHVNAHGSGTRHGDRIEAEALHRVLPGVPVTALKGYFGHLGAACGAVEMAASLLALQQGTVPAALRCDTLDPECPLDIVQGQPQAAASPVALLLNYTLQGQAAALVLRAG